MKTIEFDLAFILRKLIEKWPYRGQTRLIRLLDPWLRGKTETISLVGALRFPFLPTEGHSKLFYGLYERDTCTFMRKWLRPKDVFIDIGANVGYLTAVAADQVGPLGQVHAFEPEPNHFNRLKRFAELNPTFNIMVNKCAVIDRTGEVELFVSEHAGWHTTISGFNHPGSYKATLTVPAITLDAYITEHQLGRESTIRLIKVDVEGAETAVLRGATQLLDSHTVEAFLVEVTPPILNQNVEPISLLFEMMQINGYVAHRLRTGSPIWDIVDAYEVYSQTMVLWKLKSLEH